MQIASADCGFYFNGSENPFVSLTSFSFCLANLSRIVYQLGGTVTEQEL